MAEGARLRIGDISARLDIKERTWASYVARGQAPPPDGHFDARSPWWWESTIDDYERNRPGRGAPDTPRPVHRQRRVFTPEFKAEIVELCRRGDQSVLQIATQHDLVPSVVRTWVRQADERDPANLTASPARIAPTTKQEMRRHDR